MHRWAGVALVVGLVACSSDGGTVAGPPGAITSVDLTLSGDVTGHETVFSNHPAYAATECSRDREPIVLHWAQVFEGRTHAFHLELPRGTKQVPPRAAASFSIVASDIDRYALRDPDAATVRHDPASRTFRIDATLEHNRSKAVLRVTGAVVCAGP